MKVYSLQQRLLIKNKVGFGRAFSLHYQSECIMQKFASFLLSRIEEREGKSQNAMSDR